MEGGREGGWDGWMDGWMAYLMGRSSVLTGQAGEMHISWGRVPLIQHI